MIKNENIICLSSYYWGPLKQRYEHIMLRLSENNRILFIEFAGNILEQFKKKIWLNWLKGIKKVNKNFYVITPLPTLPFKCTIPFFNKISQNINLIFYRKITDSLGFNNPILWITRPTQLELLGKMGEKLVVYDCVDEHSGFHSIMQNTLVSRQRKVMFSMEKSVLHRADIVFTTSKRLYSTKKEFNLNTHLVPNACDVSHFSKSLHRDTKVPEIMKSIRPPVIGFYGILDKNKIDLELIEKTASYYQDYSVVLIGPKNINSRQLQNHKNIHLLEEVPYEELPNYLKAFDVAIIPFKHNDVVENTNPVKLYEYLAAGKPVVCTDFPEAKTFGDKIGIAHNEKEFINLIEAALKENREELVRQRLDTVKFHTWENRVSTISVLLEQTLKNKNVKR